MRNEINKKDIEDILDVLKKHPAPPTTHNLPVGHLGGGLYRISDGVLCGKGIYAKFQEELMRQGACFIKKKNHHRKTKKK